MPSWLRRAITFPLVSFGAAFALFVSPIWVVGALLLDIARPRQFATIRTCTFLTCYLWCELVGLLVCGALWLPYVTGLHSTEGFLALNFRLQVAWARTLRRLAFGLFSLNLVVDDGDDVAPGPVIVLGPHNSVADTMLPMMLVSEPHAIALRWVMKQELLWDPCLDVVGNRLPNCFVDRWPPASKAAGADSAAARDIEDMARGLGEHEGVLIYPEGTRFSVEKRDAIANKMAKKRPAYAQRAASFRHVLPPRAEGTLAVFRGAPGVDVVVCIHSGLQHGASFAALFAGHLVGKTIRIQIRRFAAEQLPDSRRERIDWLWSLWSDIDNTIDEWRSLDSGC